MNRTLMIFAMVLLTACTDVDGAKRALDDAGLEPIEVGGYSILGCSEDDTFKTNFTAKNQKGKTVSGQVCSGFFKGSTIRFN